MAQQYLSMSHKELDRYGIIKRLINKELNGPGAAKLLRLSLRQVKRLKVKVKRLGAEGLIHGNRGKSSNNQIPEKEHKKIISLLHEHYHDFGPTLAGEKLDENHHIFRDPKTIRAIMIKEELWKPNPKKKSQEHRSWRERKSAYGEMIQFDGSYEYWFENRGQKYCLLAAIDDASGTVPFAKLDAHEGVFPVFSFWLDYLVNNGKPRSIYLDKFSTYNMNQPLAKENSDTLTQFQRAMGELHIETISANSPQAKGRVERLFRTLQDRLIKEMRLYKISTIEEANIFLKDVFLPKFNAKFSVAPRTKTNLHEQLEQNIKNKLPAILSKQTERTILNDFTFSFNNEWHQLLKDQPATVCKKDKVIIEERIDGSRHVRLRGKYLNCELLPARPKKNSESAKPWVLPAGNNKAHKPAADHPWRQFTIKQFIASKT